MLQQGYVIGAKGISRDDIRTGGQIFQMDFTDQLGIRDANFVIATIGENMAAIQFRPHGSIEYDQLFPCK